MVQTTYKLYMEFDVFFHLSPSPRAGVQSLNFIEKAEDPKMVCDLCKITQLLYRGFSTRVQIALPPTSKTLKNKT